MNFLEFVNFRPTIFNFPSFIYSFPQLGSSGTIVYKPALIGISDDFTERLKIIEENIDLFAKGSTQFENLFRIFILYSLFPDLSFFRALYYYYVTNKYPVSEILFAHKKNIYKKNITFFLSGKKIIIKEKKINLAPLEDTDKYIWEKYPDLSRDYYKVLFSTALVGFKVG